MAPFVIGSERRCQTGEGGIRPCGAHRRGGADDLRPRCCDASPDATRHGKCGEHIKR
jgi:hypothetical protein